MNSSGVGPVLLLILILPLGCGIGTTATPTPTRQIPDITGNWQIDSASLSTSDTSGVILFGGLQSVNPIQGGTVTGDLTFNYVGQQTICKHDQLLHFTGTVDAARTLTLTSETLQGGGVVTVSMPLPETLSTYSAGGVMAISAGACAQASQVVTGALQTPLTGTYSGSLYPGAYSSTSETGTPAGTGTLALTETSLSLNGVEVFSLSGTFMYTIGSCTGKFAISGQHDGVALGMGGPIPLPSTGETFTISGAADSTGASIQVDQIEFTPFPCSTNPTGYVLFSALLKRQ